MATHVDLLRHGDTGRHGFRGQLDDPLTADGWQQMRHAVAGGQWDAIVASPLQRCAAFARELASLRGLPLRLEADWREYHFGDWQDMPLETLAQAQGDALARFWADPAAFPPPGAETFADFSARVQAAVDAVTREPGRVLVVTHGGPIRWLRCLEAGEGPARMSAIGVAHASLHRLAIGSRVDLARTSCGSVDPDGEPSHGDAALTSRGLA
jgi:alpha-ribazole phosphatase